MGQLGKEKEKKEQLGQKSDVEGGRGRRFTPKRKRRRTLKEKTGSALHVLINIEKYVKRNLFHFNFCALKKFSISISEF